MVINKLLLHKFQILIVFLIFEIFKDTPILRYLELHQNSADIYYKKVIENLVLSS